jgi:NitT/TauT family transport system permease protein
MQISLTTVLTDIISTFLRVAASTALSWLLSISIGSALHWNRFLYRLSLPAVNFLRQISPFAWLPFAILLFGLGELPIGIVLVTAMLFPGIIMVFETLESCPRDICEEALTAGAGQWQLILQIKLPVLKKQLIDIFRLQWSIGWSTVIAAEMLGVGGGLGFRLLDFRYLLEYRLMLVYIAIIGAIGILSDILLRRLAVRK